MNTQTESLDYLLEEAYRAWEQSHFDWNKAARDAAKLRAQIKGKTCHRILAWTSLTTGRIAAYRGEIERAESELVAALGRFEFLEDKRGVALTYALLCVPQIQRGFHDRALDLARRALALEGYCSTLEQALIHNLIANCLWTKSQPHEAIPHLLKEYELAKSAHCFVVEARVLANLGVIFERLGEYELSISAANRAIALLNDNGSRHLDRKSSVLANIVACYHMLDRHEHGVMYATELHALIKRSKQVSHWLLLCSLSAFYARLGRASEAQRCLERAEQLCPTPLTTFARANLIVGQALLMEARHVFNEAIALAMQVTGDSFRQLAPTTYIEACRLLERCYLSKGQKHDATKFRRMADSAIGHSVIGGMLMQQIKARLECVVAPNIVLTAQELECLKLAAHGQTSSDIGLKLGIKARTVNFHFGNIYRKLNAMNRQEAIAKAMSANII